MFSISESLRAASAAEGDHVVERGAVLALQAVDGSEPVFDFGQMFGRGLNAARIVAHGGADVFHADQGRFERGQRFLKLRLVAGQFLDLLARRTQRRSRRGIAFVEQIERIHGRVVDLLGVGQNALFVFEALVFAGLQFRVLDLAFLERPQIEQAEAVFLVALQFLDAGADADPVVIRVVHAAHLCAGVGVEQGEPRRAVERSQRFVLRMHGGEIGADQLQHGNRGWLVVHEHASLAALGRSRGAE